jgi:hypothetical protein
MMLTEGLTKEHAEAEVPGKFTELADAGYAQIVVRVAPDGQGMWGHDAVGLERLIKA